ncbi:hypothetical protein PIB30_054437 [Stylosanthes scabra]|uniref:Uncharacterized protein n=1 Tax=Stylosanthes scabra TaxID=79078 RepID=A0ABU6RJ43_9FABA|nr:hypothetical protein [Stylosanthes scabra]
MSGVYDISNGTQGIFPSGQGKRENSRTPNASLAQARCPKISSTPTVAIIGMHDISTHGRAFFNILQLKSRLSGPFTIIKVSPFGHAEIQNDKDGARFTVNDQRLKEYLDGGVDRQKSTQHLT